MKNKKASNRLPLTVLGEIFQYTVEIVSPEKLDLLAHPPIEEIHERRTAHRLAAASKRSSTAFDVVAVDGPDIAGTSVSRAEQDADDLFQYVASPIVVGTKVIYRHDLVQKARVRNEEIAIFRLTDTLPARAILPFQARYAAKEGRLTATARMEIANTLNRKLGFSVAEIRKILVGPRGDAKWSQKSIESHIRVGDLYEDFTGEPCGHVTRGLSTHNFSALLRFVEQPKIWNWMESDDSVRKHFVDVAVTAGENGSGRVHDDLAAILKFDDTSEALLTVGVAKARAVLRANHPEVSADQYPLDDFQSGTAKLRKPEIQRFLSRQIHNGGAEPFVSTMTELAATVVVLDPRLSRRIVESIAAADKATLVAWVAENAMDELTDYISNADKKNRRLQQALAGSEG